MIHVTYYEGAAALPRPSGQAGGFENAEGSGEIRCFSLLDGVTAMLMRLEMESYTELRRQTGLLELNFCVNGRFETRFSLRDHVLLKPGDMAISCCDGLHGARSESHFPLGYYEGICLEVEPAAVELVRSTRPVTQIAQSAGYDNASKFSESFKKRYGATPSQYRAHAKEAAKQSIETKME